MTGVKVSHHLFYHVFFYLREQHLHADLSVLGIIEGLLKFKLGEL